MTRTGDSDAGWVILLTWLRFLNALFLLVHKKETKFEKLCAKWTSRCGWHSSEIFEPHGWPSSLFF
jgi:hypothetical protein